MKCQDLSWGGPVMAASPTVDLRCPIWASGTRSRIIRQASYTMVEGSNCIVLTTLPMLIFSERATMVAAGLSPLLRHLLEETHGLALTAGPSGVLPPPPPLWQCLCSPKARTQLLEASKSFTSHWRAREGVPLSRPVLTLGSPASVGTLASLSQGPKADFARLQERQWLVPSRDAVSEEEVSTQTHAR